MLMIETVFNLGDVIYDAFNSPVRKRTIEKIEVLKDGTINYLAKSSYQTDKWDTRYDIINPNSPYICKTEEEAVRYFLKGRK